MSLLKELKATYQKDNTQFILVNKASVIAESDHVLFNVKPGTLLSNLHPFFLSVDVNEASKFACVHLDIKDVNLVCDIEIKNVDNNHTLIILIDFSAHYNSFQSLAQVRNETAITSEFLELKNKIILEKEAFKTKFITNFSHEVVSPIMSVLTFSDMLYKTPLSAQQKEYINVISASSNQLKYLVSDIIDLSKIENNTLEINNKRFSLKKLIRAIETEYKVKCKNKNLSFNVIYDSQMPNYVVSDKIRINQIIRNLLNNAVKFTTTGEVTITIKPIYKRARNITFSIVIKDSGIGFKKEEYNEIFNRFSRLENAQSFQGTGLGLAIVKEIVTLMNGTIEVESEPNQGTEFTVNFRATTPLIKSTTKPKSVTLESQINILLVENNLTDQLSIFKILATQKSFFLDIANNADDAVKLVNNNTYNLVLMDYNLGKQNGITVSKKIKKINSNLPILIITGSYINETLLSYKNVYYNAILSKPFDSDTLIKSIELLANLN